MRSAAVLRQQIESSLAARIPAALSPRLCNTPALVPTGIPHVDASLQGGLPLGSLTEIAGPPCSGRSTLVSCLLAGATREEAACAYVDVADAFDPLSAAAIGMNLERLLWVRIGRTVEAERGELFRTTGFQARNRATSSHRSTHERPENDWFRLDQALRATDLLLNAGGFRVIVLDMGDVLPQQVRRVPLASWYRYRLQAENSRSLLLLVAQTPCAHSCASVVLHCKEAAGQWECSADNAESFPLLTGMQYRVNADRKRDHARTFSNPLGKKTVSAAETSWTSATQWAG